MVLPVDAIALAIAQGADNSGRKSKTAFCSAGF
jgi:hypothetical protein